MLTGSHDDCSRRVSKFRTTHLSTALRSQAPESIQRPHALLVASYTLMWQGHDIRWIEEYVANLFQPIVVINLTDINRKADPFDQETGEGKASIFVIWSVILARSRYFFRRLSGSKPISMLLTISVQSHANVRTWCAKQIGIEGRNMLAKLNYDLDDR